MQLDNIAIGRLHSHPDSSNTMPASLMKKLVSHIERTDRYPPVIVRPMGGAKEGYQVLDGHHRVRAMERIGRSKVRCVVWEVSDREALVLLATLNRLEGRDDPYQRAELVARLSEGSSLDDLAKQLPEASGELNQLLALRQPPAVVREPVPVEEMPVAVYFFLLPAQKRGLEATLADLGGSREQALMKLVGRGGEAKTHRP